MGVGLYSLSSSSSSVALDISFFKSLGVGVYFLVDRTPCEYWTMCPLIFSTACGKYFAAFEYVSPGYVSKCSFLIALSHIYLTGNPTTACMYHTSVSTLGRLYALCTEGVFFASLMCGALETPQLVSERSAIVLAVSFLSNLLVLDYLLMTIL